MKINDSDNTVVERSGLASDGNFKILFNAKMAKILSDGLYSDKIQSIIRELSCNAKDSHVESGQPERPIEVHTPTQFEPWFHVRDFGIGLDHEGVVDVYTCYGVSTKTNSNDVIGQLGLGSKAPFSYVDAFDVTAIKNGVSRQYSMYKDETGMPSVALLNESPTTESNGLIIKMPVKQEDFNKFSEKAANVFTWFDVKPIVVGGPALKIPTIEYSFKGNKWGIRKKVNDYYSRLSSSKPIALMGGVAYPLDANSVSGLTKAQQILMGVGLVLHFDIGDLEVAASREALGYDVRTQTNIKNLLSTVLTDLSSSFEQSIKSAQTEWEARKIFGKIFGNNGEYNHEFSQIFGNHGLVWKNLTIKSSDVSFETSDIWAHDKNNSIAPPFYIGSSRYKKVRQKTYHQTVDIRCEDSSVIIVNDLDKGGLSRVNFMIDSGKINYNQTIYYFDLLDSTTKVTMDQLSKMLGNPTIKLTSDLPKRPIAPSAAKTRMLKYIGGNSGPKSWESVSIDFDAGGIYVLLDIWEPKILDNLTVLHPFEEIVKNAKELGTLTSSTPVYAPRGSFKDKIVNHPEWVSMWEHIKLDVDKKLTPATAQRVADSLEYRKATGVIRDASMWKTKWNITNKSSIFQKFIESMRHLESVCNSSSKDSVLIDLAKSFGTKIQSVVPSSDPEKLFKQVIATYPMIKFMVADRYSTRYITGHNDAALLESYINSIDELEELKMQLNIKQLTTV